MNTLRNTEESRQNPSTIDLMARKCNPADSSLLEMLSDVRHYFDCHQLSAITHLNDLLDNHVFSCKNDLPDHPEDLRYLLSDLFGIINHVTATVTLLSELYVHLENINVYREESTIDESSIFFKPETAQKK